MDEVALMRAQRERNRFGGGAGRNGSRMRGSGSALREAFV